MKGGSLGLTLAAVMLLTSGCDGLKQELGIGVKRPPDEFTVYSRAPLSMPPDFREIAGSLGISVRTVEVHRFNLMRRLNVRNVAQLLRQALQQNLLPRNFGTK